MKRIIYAILLFILFITGFLIIKEVYELNKSSYITIQNTQTTNFKEMLLEDTVDKFTQYIKENNIDVSNYSVVKYGDKTFLKIEILLVDNSNYLIEYEGLYVKSIYANIGKMDEKNIEDIINIVTVLFKISSTDMSTAEAKQIFSNLISQVNEKNTTAYLKHKNNMTYNLKINENGGISVYVE